MKNIENLMDFTIVELDLNYIMLDLDAIMKKYIDVNELEDLKFCFFAPNKRYPLERNIVHLYNKKVLSNIPYLPFLSAGLVMDTIKYALYRSNPHLQHYFRNVIMENLEVTDDIEKDIYKISEKPCYSLHDIIKLHIDDIDEMRRNSIAIRLQKRAHDNYASIYGKNFKKKTNKKEIDKILKDINLKYYEQIDDEKILLSKLYQNNDFDEMEKMLAAIVTAVDRLKLPMDKVYIIDDENLKHKIYTGDDIFRFRLEEAGLLEAKEKEDKNAYLKSDGD